MDYFTIHILCTWGSFMACLFAFLGYKLEFKLLYLICMSITLLLQIYRFLRSSCPCCHRCIFFIPRRWDGRCVRCGTKIP